MLKTVVVAVLAFALSGCNAIQTAAQTFDATKAQNIVFAAKSTYAAALTVAVAYNERPRCGQPTSPVICSDAALVATIRKADVAAAATLDAAENSVRCCGSNPTLLQAAVTSAEEAVKAFKAIVSEVK